MEKVKVEDLRGLPRLVWRFEMLRLVRGKDELLGGYDAPNWADDGRWSAGVLSPMAEVRPFDPSKDTLSPDCVSLRNSSSAPILTVA